MSVGSVSTKLSAMGVLSKDSAAVRRAAIRSTDIKASSGVKGIFRKLSGKASRERYQRVASAFRRSVVDLLPFSVLLARARRVVVTRAWRERRSNREFTELGEID
jgi:hypothetical protein